MHCGQRIHLGKVFRTAAPFAAAAVAGCSSADIRPESTLAEPSPCSVLADARRTTFVLYRVSDRQLIVCNKERATRRFTPASTFKIPHALLALESGAVSDEHLPFKWDGRGRGLAAWNKDTSLREAVAASTVWVFQDVAGKVGHRKEADHVRRLRYGNMEVGDISRLRDFWLSGPLSISANEQIRFLERLRSSSLSADPKNQQRVTAMLRLRSCGANCTIYGKTGAVLPIDEEGFLRAGSPVLLPPGEAPVGWFVGWVERPDADGGPLIFAHNIDLALDGAMAARTSTAYEFLRVFGVSVVSD